MSQSDRDDYKVGFSGATVPKQEAKRIYLALIVGLIVALVTYFFFGIQNKLAIFVISLVSVVIGYFLIANKLFKT